MRTIAEAQLLRSRLTLSNPQPGENLLYELLHELKVHQIELEMQNEELRKSQVALEESRDRYVDLFEFAPICYVTVGREMMVNEINLTGCTLLGLERSKIINRRFSKFVATQDTDLWDRLFMNMILGTDFEAQAFDLAMTRFDGSIFYAHLDCKRRVAESNPILLIALSTITDLKLN
jgi:PAS domain S-box-containing protein